MSIIDIAAVEAEANKVISEERSKRARDALVKQLRVVDQAEQVLRAERLKLEDIKTQIADGTL